MKVKLIGMVCGVNPEGSKDKDGKMIPVTDIYSGGEIVKVRNLEVDPTKVGTNVSVACEVQLKDFDGRKYLSVNAVTD